MSTKDLTLTFFQHLAARDLEKLTALFAERVDWLIPGDALAAPWLGARATRSEVATFYRELWAQTVALGARVDALVTDGDVAVITGDFQTRMTKTDRIVDSLFSIQLQFTDGLITKYRLLEDTLQVSRAMRA